MGTVPDPQTHATFDFDYQDICTRMREEYAFVSHRYGT